MKKWFVILWILCVNNAFSQEHAFINYSIEDGLPQSQVTSFVQDDNGYLWIGTMGGLSQYNGQNFTNYTVKNGLLSNRITSLDFRNDSLFIGHEKGISIRTNGKFYSFNFLSKSSSTTVSKIIVYKNQLIITTNGNGFYILQGGKFKNYTLNSLDQNRIRAAVILNHRLYFATRGGILYSKDGKTFQLMPNTEKLNASGLSIFDNTHLLFTTFDNEIGTINTFSYQQQIYPTQENVYGLRNCIVTSKGEIWGPHLEGILHIDSEKHIQNIDQLSGLQYENINTVFEDKEQTIWIGSEGKGIFKYTGNHIKIFHFKNESKSGLILSSYESNSDYVFGTYEGDIIFQCKKETAKKEVINTKLGTIWAISEISNNVFLLGTQSGLFLYKKKNGQLTQILQPENKTPFGKITTIYRHENTFYIGGDVGLIVYENGTISKVYDSNKLSTIRSIEYYKGNIYLGCDNGLYYFDNEKFSNVSAFRNKINSILPDKFDRLWVGTDEGLFFLKSGQLNQVTLSNRVASDLINFINKSEKYIVFGTNDGIYYTENTVNLGKAFKHLGIEQGISNLETNINSSIATKSNSFIFGTANGVDILDVSKYEQIDKINPPTIIIKNIEINSEPIEKLKDKIKIEFDDKHNVSSIELPYNKNNILILFDGISLNNHSTISFQYIISGLIDDWSPKFANPQINLSNFPNGKYDIQIRAINDDGNYSKPILIHLTINAPFYKTYWFIILASILIAFSIYWLIRTYLRRLHERNRQYKVAMEGRLSQLEQQSLNASMNRHFVFNALNSIQYFINTQDRYSANKYLSDFAKLIRKNLDASSSQQNLVLLSDEIERLKLYLSLESMRFKGKFSYEIDEAEIITEDYYVPPMLLQPFVENSIIHGILPHQDKIGLIKITIQDFLNHIEIRIKDNGIGINKSQELKMNSSNKHQSRGVELSTKRIALMKELYGEDFELIGPFQTKNEDGSISGTTVLIKIPKQNLAD